MNSKIIYFLLFLMFMNCKSINVKEIEKQLVLPGLSSGKIKFKYSSRITSTKDFKILSVKIDKINTKFNNFTIIQLPKGTLKKSGENLLPGEYYIELNVPKNEIKKESIEVVTIEILLGNKRFYLKGRTLLIDDLLGK